MCAQVGLVQLDRPSVCLQYGTPLLLDTASVQPSGSGGVSEAVLAGVLTAAGAAGACEARPVSIALNAKVGASMTVMELPRGMLRSTAPRLRTAVRREKKRAAARAATATTSAPMMPPATALTGAGSPAAAATTASAIADADAGVDVADADAVADAGVGVGVGVTDAVAAAVGVALNEKLLL